MPTRYFKWETVSGDSGGRSKVGNCKQGRTVTFRRRRSPDQAGIARLGHHRSNAERIQAVKSRRQKDMLNEGASWRRQLFDHLVNLPCAARMHSLSRLARRNEVTRLEVVSSKRKYAGKDLRRFAAYVVNDEQSPGTNCWSRWRCPSIALSLKTAIDNFFSNDPLKGQLDKSIR